MHDSQSLDASPAGSRGLSGAIGSGGFGTDYRLRAASGQLDGDYVPVDFVSICAGLGARAVRARTWDELAAALVQMREADRTCAVVIETDKEARVPGYESWWDVPISEVSEIESIRRARAQYEQDVKKERRFEVSGA